MVEMTAREQAYRAEKAELASLGLIFGPSSNPDRHAMKCLAQSKQKEIQAARAAYLAEHGAAECKKRFPRCHREVWPQIG
jgi:hypothetical protein